VNQIKPSLDFFEPNQRLTVKKSFDKSKINRILVQGIDQLGGLMMSTPFFRELRLAFPDAYIVNLVGPLTYEVMQNCPHIDEVWLFDKKQSFAIAKKIRAFQFDLTFLPSGTFRTALIAFLGRVKHRIGYDSDGTKNLLTIQLHLEFHSRYRPENIFDLLRAIGISPHGVYQREAWVSKENREYAKVWKERAHCKNNKLLGFNPFSTDPKRRWKDEHWKNFLIGLKSYQVEPVMLVAPNEVEKGKKLIAEWRLDGLAVEGHSVVNTLAMLEFFDYVVGVDSGFVHMALAVNKPHVIAFFNVLPPKSTFPIDNKNHKALIAENVLCAPCYLYKFKDVCPNKIVCMKELQPEMVLEVINQFEEATL